MGLRYISDFTREWYNNGNRTRVHHGKQEKATTAHTRPWYIIEYGMKVHQLRQDEGTSQKTGEWYITEDRI